MEKTYNEIIGFNNTLAGMSRERWPFGVTLAKNIKLMDKIIADYNEKRQAVIDQFVKRDENGEILGVMLDVKVSEGEEPRQERVKNPTRIDETEWIDREAFDKAVADLNSTKINLELIQVDANQVYFNLQANRDMTIAQYLDSNAEPGLMIYLSEFGFFKNLDL
jgi:hypothetical protein